MGLVHKSVDVRADVWRKLRVNAELSGAALRDYLTYLIEQSNPVSGEEASEQALLLAAAERNRRAARAS